MEIKCDFVDYESGYFCSIKNFKIPNNVENVKFVGNHKNGKSNASVIGIHFLNCELQKIPENLTKIFPNLTTLWIDTSKDLLEIRKEDLKGLEKLKEFTISSCSLEYLPGNLFEDMKDLEWINFINNQLKFIGENLLDGLTKLRFVDFYGNKNIDLYFDANNRKGSTLDDIKKEIREKYAPDYFLETLEQLLIESKKKEDNLLKNIADLEQKLKVSDENMEKIEENLSKKDEEFKNLKEIVDDIKKLAGDENFKDINVKIEDEEFKLHKFILAARSPTFSELFTENPAAEELKLVDVSVDAFKIFIDFVYNNRLPQNEVNSLKIFQMAGRMKVEKLKEFAAAKLMTEINPENAFEILKCANKHQHEELIKKSFEEVKKMFPKVELKDELAKHPEKIQKLIDAKSKKEEMMRTAELEFEAARKEKEEMMRVAEQKLEEARRDKEKLIEEAKKRKEDLMKAAELELEASLGNLNI